MAELRIPGLEIGDMDVAVYAKAKARVRRNLARSIRDHRRVGHWLIHGSADRGRRPSSTSIAFEPCRVEDVLPTEFITATYDLFATASADRA
jgi:hypothetical protein